MSKTLINATVGRDRTSLQSLAIAPFSIEGSEVGAQDAETLAQILAIEILNTGKYVVLPRTSAMQAALNEMNFQNQGYTSDDEAVSLGRAINADLVLFGGINKLGNVNMFTAQVLHVQDGSLRAGASRDYRVLADGVDLMAKIAELLTGQAGAQKRNTDLSRQRERSALFTDTTRFWSAGASAGTSFAEPWLIGTVQATLAPFRYSFFRIGSDFGVVSGVKGVDYYMAYPFVHYAFFLPFEKFTTAMTKGGFHIGVGGGFMASEYGFDDFTIARKSGLMDVTTGINIANIIDISYSLRTNFSAVNHKFSVGYTHRFLQRSR